MLVNVLKRAKELAENGVDLFASNAFAYFLYNKINKDNFNDNTLEMFSKLDDYDILLSIKEWVHHEDKVLSTLSKMIVERKFLKVEMQSERFSEAYVAKKMQKFQEKLQLTESEISYFVFTHEIKNQAYTSEKPILIINKKGKLSDIAKASDQLNLQALTKPVFKHIICYPK